MFEPESLPYWVPFGVGLHASAKMAHRDVTGGAVNPRKWFSPPGAAGTTARESAIASGLRGAGRNADAAYTSLISQMGTDAKWRTGIPFTPDQTRSAIMESTRASLLRGRKMSPENINLAVSRVELAPMKGPGNAFEIAASAVRQGGRQRVFHQTMSDFIAGNRIPGKQWSIAAENKLMGGKRPSSIMTTGISSLTTAESSQLARIKARIPGQFKVNINSIMERTSDVSGTIRSVQLGISTGKGSGSISIPLTEGWMAGGREFENIYATQKIIPNVAGKKIGVSSFSDFYAQQFFDDFLPEAVKNQGKMGGNTWRRMIADFDASMSRYMMWTPGTAHAGQDLAAALHQQHLGVPQVASGILNADEAYELLYRKGFGPALSPTGIKGGKVWGQVTDLRKDMWGYGSAFPYERRPGQFLRDMSLSPAARAATEGGTFGPGGIFSRATPFMAPEGRRALIETGNISPQVMMTYAASPKMEAALRKTGLESEEMFMRNRAGKMFETDLMRTVDLDVTMPTGGKVNQFIESELAEAGSGQAFTFPTGKEKDAGKTLIGYEPGTGKAIYAKDLAGVSQRVESMEYIGGSKKRVRLMMRETYTAESMVKVFGQLKGTAKLRNSAEFDAIMKEMGIPHLSANTDAITYMDDVRKNRTFLRLQMSSALAEQAGERLQAMRGSAAELARWQSVSPIAELESFVSGSARNAAASNWAWGGSAESGIIQQARAWNMPRLGEIGGLIPRMTGAFTEGELAGITSAAGGNLAALESPIVRGTATLSPGDYPHFMGGGNRGSIEPRGFSQLLGQKWNVTGGYNVAEGLAGEMARSMESFGPEISELNRIADTLGGGKISGSPSVGISDALRRSQLIGSEGYTLDLGQKLKALGGGSSIYIPPEKAIRQVGYFRTDPGTLQSSALTGEIQGLADAAGRARRARNAEDLANAVESMEKAAGRVRTSVGEAIGIATYGRGGDNPLAGALRGKMVGSKYLYLQGMGNVAEADALRTTRISQLSADEMVSDMMRNAATDEERAFVRSQQERLTAGKKIAGTVSRHPMIGPYSIQPTWLQVAKGAESETTHFAQVAGRVMEKVEGPISEVNFSQVVGMGADYDGDRLTVKMIGDKKVASATAELLTSGAFQKEYQQFVMESSLLTGAAKQRATGSAAGILGSVESMITGSMKLRIGAVETGYISEAMTKAKLATSTYAQHLAPRFNVMAEILEQQIISGKHMTGQSVAALQQQNIAQRFSQNIMSAATNTENRAAIEALVSDTRNILGPEIESGIRARVGQADYMVKQDLTKMWETVTESMRRGSEQGGVLSEYSSLVRRKGMSGEFALADVQAALKASAEGRGYELTNLAMRGAPSSAGPMQQHVTKMIGRINKGIKEAGAVAKKWGKPALYGLAATAGAALLTGGPKPRMMEPPDPTLMGRGDHGRMTPEDMPVPEGVSGSPTAPGMASPSAYLTQSARPGQRIVARASSDYAPNYDSVSNALRPIAGSGNANITFHDNRRKLTPDRIADMMEGY